MGSTAGMRSVRRSRGLAVALTAALSLGAVVAVPGLAPTAFIAAAQEDAAAANVRVDSVAWETHRRVRIGVFSPAMNRVIPVQLMLPADWYVNPEAKFPVLYGLDGLRALDDASGWTVETNIEQFTADKNAIFALPIGGAASFYSDWNAQVGGKDYKWETFLVQELPRALKQDWRANDSAGIFGLSMGGTAALTLAGRNPRLYKFAGSFSGYLDTTSFGMPEAIKVAMGDVDPELNPTDMWGEPGSDNWNAHDPGSAISGLKETSVYVSAGTGNTGPYDNASPIPGVSDNYAGSGLELISRMTTQTWVARARAAGLAPTVQFRPSGTHSWPYWQFELSQAWPQMAAALGVAAQAPEHTVAGQIGEAAQANPALNGATTPEYVVPGGRAQDFRGGQVLWSEATGAQVISGRIAGHYRQLGATTSSLGFPTSGENRTPDEKGRFTNFQNGAIYWTPKTGAAAVQGALKDNWAQLGWEAGTLGYPLAEDRATPDGVGRVQAFEHGIQLWRPETGAAEIRGDILGVYGKSGYERGDLGYPVSNEIPLGIGAMSRFEKGSIYWHPILGAHIVPFGDIYDAWGREGYENGKFGFPASGLVPVDGGVQINFERGWIKSIDGRIETS